MIGSSAQRPLQSLQEAQRIPGLHEHTGTVVLPWPAPLPRGSPREPHPHPVLSSPSRQLLGAPQCTILGPVSWCEASRTRVEAAAAQTQPAGAGVLSPDHAGGHGPALCCFQVHPCVLPGVMGRGRGAGESRWGQPPQAHHPPGLHFWASQAKNCPKLVSGASPYLAKAALHSLKGEHCHLQSFVI